MTQSSKERLLLPNLVCIPAGERDVRLRLHNKAGRPEGTVFSYWSLFFLKKFFNLFKFIWLSQILVAAVGIFSFGMWDLVPQPGIEPGPPALGTQSLGHWMTLEVLVLILKSENLLQKQAYMALKISLYIILKYLNIILF